MKVRIATLLFQVSACVWLHAQADSFPSSRIDVFRQPVDLTSYARIFADTTHALRIEDISGHASAFTPLSAFQKNINPRIPYWIVIPISTDRNIEDWWLIVKSSVPYLQHYAGWEHMDAWLMESGGGLIEHQVSGLSTPRSRKKLQAEAGLVAAEISLTAGKEYLMVLRISIDFADRTNEQILLELRDPALGIPHTSHGDYLWVLSGIAGVTALLSLFFFVFVREKAYLFFTIYCIFLSLHYLILHPFIPFANWFIPENPHLTVYCFYILAPGGFIIFMLFGREFINLPLLSRKTDRLLLWFLGIWAGSYLIEFFVMATQGTSLLDPYAFLPVLIAFAFIVRFAFFRSILARFFVAGAAWLLFFTVLGLLYARQLLEYGFNPWPVGQIGQMAIYMAGLAFKIRLIEQSKAEAQRIRDLDQIKTRFFANISHEFRTPLTLISGHLQQVEANAKSADAIQVGKKQLHTMRRNADRMLELVNQLLDLSKLDSQQMKLRVIKGDVLQVLRTLSGAFDALAERKQIHFHRHFPDSTQITYFDQDKLEKIFTNVLSNSFKYTPERGTVSVNVEIDEHRLRISVEDSGSGISKKELDKIFDRFYQVEGNEDKGSGIGLALVKELVDLYRGVITVQSDPGRGSQFRISLPVNKSDFKENELVDRQENKDEETIAVAVEAEEPKPGLPVLLIVEDNEDLREFMKESLQGQYHVLEAVDGKQGFEKAVSEIPDLIISDVMMPVMDGFVLTTQLRQDERTSHIPVILLTAKADQSNKLEGLHAGADEYLTKPFDVRELLVRTHNLVSQRKLLRKKFAGNIQLKPSEVTVKSIDQKFLIRVMEEIEKHIGEEEFSVEELSRLVAMSRSQLHRKLVALIDKTPSELLRQTRLFRAKELLEKKAGTPSEIAFQVGFNSHTYFSKCFKEEFGMSPSEV